MGQELLGENRVLLEKEVLVSCAPQAAIVLASS